MDYSFREITSLDTITLLLIACFCVLALSKLLFPKRFDEFIMLAFTNKYFTIQGKENKLLQAFNLLLFGVQIISISLFIFLFFSTKETVNNLLLLQIIIGYSLFVLVKLIFEKIVSTIFSIEGLVNSYLYYKLSYRNYFSVFLLLCHFFIVYYFQANELYFISIAILLSITTAISLLYYYVKHKTLIFSNLFYFILYLCTLEISPYYLLYKALY